jgi:lipoprotein-anchoring transpeptidase ErfK/SrfK
MERIRKTKKSPYFIANILLLIALLFLLIGYANKINSEAKNKTQDNKDFQKDFFSTFEDRSGIKNITARDIDKNINIEEGEYVKIIGSCDIHFVGNCVRARACPSLECPTVADLRNEMVLKTDGEITNFEGIKWYHIVFDEWVRYPDRTARDWYISSDYLKEVDSYTEKIIDETKIATSTKKIVVKLSEQKLYAYDGDNEFMETYISSGLDDLPTPIGTFNIFSKTPSRYMQGPIPGVSDQEYNLPGVPWTMYFTHSGAAIHGAYWHNNFGEQWSHGCINLNPPDAEILYAWADAGTQVVVEK